MAKWQNCKLEACYGIGVGYIPCEKVLTCITPGSLPGVFIETCINVKNLAEVEVTPSGKGLHWKTLDVDLSIPALMNGIFGTKKWIAELARKGGNSTSFAKSEASRLNGTKGDRP